MKSLANQSLFFAMFVVLISSCKSKKEEVKVMPVKVNTQTIQKVNRQQELSYSATIEPDNTALVGFAVPGVVNSISVEEGDPVGQGQLLAGIDATEYSNSLHIANASLEQTQDLYARLNELYLKGSLPAKDYIDIKTKVEQAKATKNITVKHISDSRLYSPISGIVTQRLIERGSAAAPGMVAFAIIKTDMVYARITVPESEVGKLKQGMETVVFVPTLNDTLKGKITIINPQADYKSKTYSVKIKLNNSQRKLLPGMLADVSINPNRNEQVIMIPAEAVVRDNDDLTYVYVVNAEKKAIRQRIFAGGITGTQELIVKEGLSEGDVIVTAGQLKLKDGAAVSF
jgi:membrane fusion protein (multidrug efflux system)